LAVLTVVVHPEGGSTPVAARHEVAVTVDEVAPAAVTVLSMVIVQVTSYPAPVGKAGGSHCAAAGAVAAAEAAGALAKPARTSIETAVIPTTIAVSMQRMAPTRMPRAGGIMSSPCSQIGGRGNRRRRDVDGQGKARARRKACGTLF
jgi:hypothetical protein